MSLVRYTNKKTGVVTVYESTSHYDPVTKQSRPIRKYLGVEDPKTGQIIPSSGKPGRKKASDPTSRPAEKKEGIDYKLLYEAQQKENAEKDARIKELENKNKLLTADLERLEDTVYRVRCALIKAAGEGNRSRRILSERRDGYEEGSDNS